MTTDADLITPAVRRIADFAGNGQPRTGAAAAATGSRPEGTGGPLAARPLVLPGDGIVAGVITFPPSRVSGSAPVSVSF
jgi:hypothetical protein